MTGLSDSENAGELTITGVSVRLGGRLVLEDVSATARPGTLTGLIGPNGAGKTTLMRTVLGFTRLTSGSVLLDGAPVSGTHIGYVPQRHAFAWDFPINVHDTVLSGRISAIGWFRGASAADRAATAEALALTHLTDLRFRPIAELSGGQRQRVLVARALAMQPRILLLDEPFTGLDMPSQESLTALFRRLARDGRTVVMSTHDITSAIGDCDRLWLLNRRLIAAGSPQELHTPATWVDTFKVSDGSPFVRAVLALTGS